MAPYAYLPSCANRIRLCTVALFFEIYNGSYVMLNGPYLFKLGRTIFSLLRSISWCFCLLSAGFNFKTVVIYNLKYKLYDSILKLQKTSKNTKEKERAKIKKKKKRDYMNGQSEADINLNFISRFTFLSFPLSLFPLTRAEHFTSLCLRYDSDTVSQH
jgi:hypothetical protein